MPANYGKCPHCNGTGAVIVEKSLLDCMACDGDGKAKDGVSYMQREADAEWERNKGTDMEYKNYV